MDYGQNLSQGFSDAWNSVATFVPKLIGFLVVLVIGWIIAKAVAKLVDKVLERVGFDRVVERGGIKRMLEKSKYDASDIIAKLVYYAILLIALQIAFSVFGPNPVSAMLTAVVAWLPLAVVAIVIVVVAGAIAKAVKDLITNALGGLSYGPLLGTLASVFIWGLGIIAALNQIGVATAVTMPVLITVLAIVAGIAIVGVGGGLVRPMQSRWDRWLDRAEDEVPQAKAAATDAYQRGREDARRSTSGSGSQQSGERTSVRAGQARSGGSGQHHAAHAAPEGRPSGGTTTGSTGTSSTGTSSTGTTGRMPPPPDKPPNLRPRDR
ncbi:membrane protein [Actinophytocola sediminis]